MLQFDWFIAKSLNHHLLYYGLLWWNKDGFFFTVFTLIRENCDNIMTNIITLVVTVKGMPEILVESYVELHESPCSCSNKGRGLSIVSAWNYFYKSDPSHYNVR